MRYLDREYPPLTDEQTEVMRKFDKVVGKLQNRLKNSRPQAPTQVRSFF